MWYLFPGELNMKCFHRYPNAKALSTILYDIISLTVLNLYIYKRNNEYEVPEMLNVKPIKIKIDTLLFYENLISFLFIVGNLTLQRID